MWLKIFFCIFSIVNVSSAFAFEFSLFTQISSPSFSNQASSASIVPETKLFSCPIDMNLRFGTAIDDQIHGSVSDENGNVYIVGFENGMWGVENWWPIGNAVGFVEKRSSDGALLWRRIFDTAGIDLIETVALDPLRNGIVVAGRTSGAFAGFTNAGQMDLFVATLDMQGNVTSLGQFGDDRPQHPIGVTVLPDGDVIVAGYDDTFVVGTGVIDWENGFVARFHIDPTNNMNTIWWSRSPLPASDLVLAVVGLQDGTGDIVIATNTAMSAQQGGGAHVKRITGQGSLVWSNSVSTSTFDYVFTLAISATGKLYAAGATINSLFSTSLGDSDSFLLEIDSDTGATVWSKQFGSLNADGINSLAVDSIGRLYVLGTAFGTVTPGFSVTVPPDELTPFIMSFSPSGQWLGTWQSSVPSLGANEYSSTPTILPGCDGRTAIMAGSAKNDIQGMTSFGGSDSVIQTISLTLDEIFADKFE